MAVAFPSYMLKVANDSRAGTDLGLLIYFGAFKLQIKITITSGQGGKVLISSRLNNNAKITHNSRGGSLYK